MAGRVGTLGQGTSCNRRRARHLAVRHGGEQGVLQPETPHRQALGVAAGTEVAALAGEGEQVLPGGPGSAIFTGMMFGVLGGGSGTLLGGTIGAATHRWRTVYSAAPP